MGSAVGFGIGPNITGVILAGGRSRRFGANKAFAKLRGIPLIEYVLRVMRTVFGEIVIVTNRPEECTDLGVPVFKDEEPYLGPLGGLTTAFHHASYDRIFVTACDTPFLRADAIVRVIEAGKGYEAAVPTHDGRREYLMGLYSKNLLPWMEECLREGKGSLHEFCEKIPRVAWIPVGGDTWFNVNTKEDLEFLEGHHAG